MKVLLIGGYGLIGRSVCRHLLDEGHEVIGFGRSLTKGLAAHANIEWRIADMVQLQTAAKWSPFLKDIDAVVNCAGVLQDGMGDDVSKVQFGAVRALVDACENADIERFVQISAPGVSLSSDTEFYRSKAKADDIIAQSGLCWTILRPGLVLAPHSYGGTSLIRMLAAMPIILPIFAASAPVQTVSVSDVSNCVARAVNGEFNQQDIDLVEEQSHSLIDVISAYRNWLGWSEKPVLLHVSQFIGRLAGYAADLAGWLGWRPAIRTTSLKVLSKGVRGDPSKLKALSGMTLSSLPRTLESYPATSQDRVHAKALLAFPVLLILLSTFWIVSGVIGLIGVDAASKVLLGTSIESVATLSVIVGGLLDIAVGVAMLVRPWSKPALIASVSLALSYLGLGSFFTPEIWTDPLGPFVKIFPVIGLAVSVYIMQPER